MKSFWKASLGAALFAFTPIVPATAAPIFNPANGHFYDLTPTFADWNTTRALAQGMAPNADLVTVNDAAEQAFLAANFGVINGVTNPLWIGFNDIASEGTFVWANGETPGFTSWCSFEPNNLGNEDATVMNWCAGSSWNDLNVSIQLQGVAEWAPSSVPEPATLGLIGLGLAGLGIVARRRKTH